MGTTSQTDTTSQPDSTSCRGASALALSISGGGHRAAAFGLGTIALLQDLDLMDTVVVISTVSGGSLVGSFYLCAKARAVGEAAQEGRSVEQALASWRADGFRQLFLEPFCTFLHSRTLAEQLVQQLLPLPLGRRDKLIRGAAQRVQSLLDNYGYPTHLGHGALRALLQSPRCLPDHAFFNAADLTSLDLFRFGVTREGGHSHGSFVVNNIRIPVDPNHQDPASELAAGLRIADCVAASFCFPGGFEPLVFPGDFLDPAEPGAAQLQRERIVRRLCDGRRAVALMDGGLYDNLGLASVEVTIRAIRETERRQLAIDPGAADPRRQRIYVLATDVDNIQPANKVLDPRSQQRQPPRPPLGPPGPGPVDWLRALPSGWGLLLGPLLLAGGIAALPLLLVLLLAARLPVLRPPLLRWLQRSPRIGRPLLDLGIVLDPQLIAAAAAAPVTPRCLADGAQLWAGRRLAELLPAFNGYLKRTRNLTYQALHDKYNRFGGGNPNTFLLRNLIFQLAPGRDCDPTSGLDELTRPLQPYPPRIPEICLDPDRWIVPKLERITPLLSLPATAPPGVDGERLAQLQADLALDGAVRCWNGIVAVMDDPTQPPPPGSPTLSQLQPVALAVQQAWGPHEGRPLAGRHLLSRVCEMATNLPTTLWLEDYRVYAPSRYDPTGEALVQGGWFVDRSLLPQDRRALVFDRGLAVELAIAAGRINTCFNLLEFCASRLLPPPRP
jgi:predicted acylesterase/phospholipase RssA